MKKSLCYCADCPFLKINRAHNEYWDCAEEHVNNATIHYDQKNTCLLMKSLTLWNVSRDGALIDIKQKYHNWLSDGTNPKKLKQCLDLTKFILIEEK